MSRRNRNPVRVRVLAAGLALLSGCQTANWSTSNYPDWSGSAPGFGSNSPELGSSTPDPNVTSIDPPQSYSTERPQSKPTESPVWEKSVPLIRGPIDLGTPTNLPPDVPRPHTVRSTPANPAPATVPDSAVPEAAAPDAGPQLPLFVDEPAGEPMFRVELPADALQNEPINVKVEIWNEDDRPRGPLRLTLTRPETVHNLSPLGDELAFETLAPGERRSQTLSLAVTAPGEHSLEWKLTEADREVGWKKVSLTGRTSKLDARLIGPKTKPLGQRAEFTLSVVNTSAEPLGNIAALLEYDRAIVPVEASEGAEQRPGRLAWTIPVLQPGEALYLQVEFDCPLETGSACVTADISAAELPAIQRRACVAVERTTGSLQVLLADQNDLARRGQNVTLVLRATNLGLQPARRLVAELDLPEGLELSDYTVFRGNEVVPLPAQVDERVLRFESVDRLASDQTIEYRVVLETQSSGEFELTGRITDELHQTPVTAKEPLTITP